MLRGHMHRVVDEFCHVPRALLGDEHAALACSHLRGAHREVVTAGIGQRTGTERAVDSLLSGAPEDLDAIVDGL